MALSTPDGVTSSSSTIHDVDESEAFVQGLKENLLENTVWSSVSGEFGPTHFGLHVLLRQWIDFAITRRSLVLLAKASSLAKKTGISMDQLLCGRDWPPEWGFPSTVHYSMKFLPERLLSPRDEQVVVGDRMRLTDIAEPLLIATYCSRPPNNNSSSFIQQFDTISYRDDDHDDYHNEDDDNEDDLHLYDRWITIKEMHSGVVQFYTSPAFERDVCSWVSMQERWQRNQGNVMELFLPRNEMESYARGLTHQISLHTLPNKPPYPTRLPTTMITLKTGQPVTVECIQCFHVENIDTSLMFLEFIRVDPMISEFPSPEPFSLESIATIDGTIALEDWLQEINSLDYSSPALEWSQMDVV
ncbi:GAL4-like Zn(II)2Cys6 (or C6 zinc) binuclear cluster DNA-binding domain [Fragilaria crotonensis]|nr:GAL4-like Zn(II)2Cys6 (or C6 zinc) binuclear cluster DNA-binding domain [Fragilaria crotonensis]